MQPSRPVPPHLDPWIAELALPDRRRRGLRRRRVPQDEAVAASLAGPITSPRRMAVVGLKGGTGKTTLAVAMAMTYAQARHRRDAGPQRQRAAPLFPNPASKPRTSPSPPQRRSDTSRAILAAVLTLALVGGIGGIVRICRGRVFGARGLSLLVLRGTVVLEREHADDDRRS